MDTISVGVVDDHALAREGLEMLLADELGIRVAGSVADSTELKLLMSEDPPDVILMDIKLEEENGLELTRWLRQEHPDVHVIILSNYDEGPFVIEAISVGAAGYLLKDCSSALLLHTIHAVTDGAVLFKKELLMHAFGTVSAASTQSEQDAVKLLTDDERDVLLLMETGTRNRTIGVKLHLSEATVKNRVQSILSKLHVANRTEAASVATRVGVSSALPPPPDTE